MNKKEFRQLCEQKIIVLDGATGTELQKRGLPLGDCPEKWAANNPSVMVDIQKSYLDAGADIIYTCTFGASRPKLESFGLQNEVHTLNKTLAEIARTAVRQSGKTAYIAGDLAPTGKLIYPIGELLFEDAVAVYKEQVRGLLEGGVDLFVIETMLNIQEARAALLAVRESCDLPVMASVTLEPNGKMLTGTDPVTALVTLQSLGADAVGLNCSTGPDRMVTHLAQMRPFAKVPLFAKANAGLPVFEDGETKFTMAASAFGDFVAVLAENGANLIGGCCGTTPEYIRRVKEKATELTPPAIGKSKIAALSSATKTLTLTGATKTLLIGERINPTGKKAMQQAVLDGDFSYIADMAADQKQNGADILDVNLGMGGIDEAERMQNVIDTLSVSCDLPLCIDSSDPKAIAAALRVYQGRALVNSVSLEKRKIAEILPVAAYYGAMIIALPLSDEGIPADFSGRRETIQKIAEEAAKHGLQKEDLVVDGLVMTFSAEQKSAKITTDTIRWCAEEFGAATVIGLSNISFGLPQRAAVNAAFLSVAVYHGLTMVIGNPSNTEVMRLKDAADVLHGKDESALNYIAAHAGTPPQTPKRPVQKLSADAPQNETEKTAPKKAYESILKGVKDGILPIIQAALDEGVPAKTLIERHLIPAITKVGELYEEQVYFLPQLVLSAKTMETAFEFLQPYLTAAAGEKPEKPIKIVIATVRGDIHDIGKNIVKLMLKNNGFDVIDLGKDVPGERIVQTALEENADIVGLSALMTTTMTEMEKVIQLLKEKGAKSKVIVGGAVITPRYAEQIGADAYSADAATAVRTVKGLMGI
ncbi:MAG: homocysteine S-methyltransferase family protein [Clostridiales bacterium]|nr:homocysteine S-methyltransferase family protein [Clostridiales bacterium]